MLDCKITLNPTDVPIHKVSEGLKNFFDNNDHFISNFNVVSENLDTKIYLFFNDKNNFSMVFEKCLDEVFISLVKIVCENKKIDIGVAFNILELADVVSQNEEFFYKIFPLIGWQSYKKGYHYFTKLKNMETILAEKVINKKVSIVEAILFDDYFKEDYFEFINKLPDDLTFSEFGQLLRNLTEFAKNRGYKLEDLYRLVDFSTKQNLLTSVFNLKFDSYVKIKDKFETFLDKLNFKNGVEVIYEKSFEKEDYYLQIKFRDLKSLHQKLSNTKDKIENIINSNEKDLFNQDLLFEDENYAK